MHEPLLPMRDSQEGFERMRLSSMTQRRVLDAGAVHELLGAVIRRPYRWLSQLGEPDRKSARSSRLPVTAKLLHVDGCKSSAKRAATNPVVLS